MSMIGFDEPDGSPCMYIFRAFFGSANTYNEIVS